MPTIRQQRVSELLFEELSIMIGNELTDPRLLLVQVTSVVVSRDLRNVKVYVSHDNEDATKEEVLRGLRHATPFLRRQLATRSTLRAVPELLFYYDDTPERAARVQSLLRQISAQRGEAESATGENFSPENGTADSGTVETGTADSGTVETGTAESGSAENLADKLGPDSA